MRAQASPAGRRPPPRPRFTRVGPYQPPTCAAMAATNSFGTLHVPLRHRGIRPTHDLHDGRRDTGCCLPPLPGPVCACAEAAGKASTPLPSPQPTGRSVRDRRRSLEHRRGHFAPTPLTARHSPRRSHHCPAPTYAQVERPTESVPVRARRGGCHSASHSLAREDQRRSRSAHWHFSPQSGARTEFSRPDNA